MTLGIWSPEHLANLVEHAQQVAIEAGDLILGMQKEGNFSVEHKADESPVTSVDFAASDRITELLSQATPDVPILTEEALVPWHVRRRWEHYWLVDPLDGTQEFIHGSGDFAVSIALIRGDRPELGVIYWPAQDALYYAVRGQGAWRIANNRHENISVRRLEQPATGPITIALSRRQPADRILSRMVSGEREIMQIQTGSCALKSCLVAEGSADCFVRVGETGEWDTAAAQVLVEEAGGSLTDEAFRPLRYNHTASPVNPNFLVLGDPRIDWQALLPGGLQSSR
ncbi:MAG: 3'(2'),5'-bisphosphate nucleotidase CysQ [Idiomarina sp.]|nr:3'(2'),5'-bisphosphate nucleotidase CysQ [Idiomarina sp.]